jgi:hypothetical protein
MTGEEIGRAIDERLQRTDDNLSRLAGTVRLHVEGGNGISGG